MTDIEKLSNVAYKKGNWMRYTLWGIGLICVAILFVYILNQMNGEISAAVPKDYKFSVTDDYNGSNIVYTTYYVYNDRIIVEDVSVTEKGDKDRLLLVYENINTRSLNLDEEDTTEICELGACSQKPKVMAVIKKIVSRKTGREYMGL